MNHNITNTCISTKIPLKYKINKKNEIESQTNTTQTIVQVKQQIVNKGTGAGGKQTNINGKQFEEITNNEKRLLEQGFKKMLIKDVSGKEKKNKYNWYLTKIYDTHTTYFFLQTSFKSYMKSTYDIIVEKDPDEAYLIVYNNGKKNVKILEKKNQNVSGSVEDKIMAGGSFKRYYELVLGTNFIVDYGFCVSDFLKQKFISNVDKYKHFNTILNESNIVMMFGDDKDYYHNLDEWIKS